MAVTEFHLFKIGIDPVTGRDVHEAIEPRGAPLDFLGLRAAMHSAVKEYGPIVCFERALMLHINQEPQPGTLDEPTKGVWGDQSYALSYREVAELLAEYPKDVWVGYAVNPEPFIASLEECFGTIDEESVGPA